MIKNMKRDTWAVLFYLALVLAIIIVLVCFAIFAPDVNKQDEFTTSYLNTIFGSSYQNINRGLVRIGDREVGLVTLYHYDDPQKTINNMLKRRNKPYIIILDGEPKKIPDLNGANLIITTKEDPSCFPPNVPRIYNPYFIYQLNHTDQKIKDKYLPMGLSDYTKIKSLSNIEKTKFCFFAYGNCDERFQGVVARKKFYYLLQELSNNRIDNCGRCYNTNKAKTIPKLKDDENIANLAPYKFSIAFENEHIQGLMTEKILLPMIAGVIPIYLGAPNVTEYFNPKRFIHVRDFASFEECARYVLKVDSDPELYRSYIEQPIFVQSPKMEKLFSYMNGGCFYRELKKILPKDMAEEIPMCKMGQQEIRFLTFADGQKYKYDRILEEAKKSNYFNSFAAYDLNDFLIRYPEHRSFIESNPRGVGYWIWKSILIRDELKKMNTNDILIWSDSGNTIQLNTERFNYYIDKLNQDPNGILASLMNHQEKSWSKTDTIQRIGTEESDLDSGQFAASLHFWRKTETSLKFLDEWIAIGQEDNYHHLTDAPSRIPNAQYFSEHRHDQSIFSLLAKKYKVSYLTDYLRDDTKETMLSPLEYAPFVISRKKN